VGETRLVCSTKPSKGRAPASRCPLLQDVRDGARQLAMLDLVPQRHAALLKPGVELVRLGNGGTTCHRRWRASRTFFSTWPFSQPEAGLQNSASNRKWLTMAAKRALTSRSLPRRTRSTAVRMLS
jgi:hypothetical protein